MTFVLIFIALTFVCIAAFQFLYLFYLERIEREHKNKIRELERRCKQLTEKLHETENELNEQKHFITSISEDNEVWADIISEH